MKSRTQPTSHWSAGRVCPGILATNGAPGVAAVSSWTVPGLMSSSMAVTAPALTKAAPTSAGSDAIAAAYRRLPEASSPNALLGTRADHRRGWLPQTGQLPALVLS